ncbi:hypothetical protein ACSBR1_005597 [Camellia fascicularis]
MASKVGIVGWLVVVTATIMGGATAETYTVGGSLGWQIPSGGAAAYTSWAANETFKAGDILVFNWTGTHNVARVYEADFNNCISSNAIDTIQDTSPYSITLSSDNTYYFICGVGPHCTLGQKVSISVGNSSAAASNGGARPLTTAGAAAFWAVVVGLLAVSLSS